MRLFVAVCGCFMKVVVANQLLLPQYTHDVHMHDNISHNCLTG